MTARVLIVGGDGVLGRALAEAWRGNGIVTATTRRRETLGPGRMWLDLAADPAAWRPPAGTDVAYLMAAVTATRACREDPVGTWQRNVEALGTIAHVLLAAGAFVVFPSTNLVFDGTVPCRAADDTVCPMTEYGRQKAEGERRLLGEAGTAVVRLTKVVTADWPLLRAWAASLRAGRSIHPLADLVMAPLRLADTVAALAGIGERRLAGITQVSAPEDVSYVALARSLAARLGQPPELVQPLTAAAAGADLEHLPAHTTLDGTRLRQTLDLRPPPAAEVLAEVVARLAEEA